MFLCLLLPLYPKEVNEIQNEAANDSLDEWLIACLLYPKLIVELLSNMDSTSQLIIHSHQIKLIDLTREVENELLVTFEFSSLLSTHLVADYRVAYKIDALGDITMQSFETLTVYHEAQELLAKISIEAL